MKDRFSLHIHDGQTGILEALTVMRNGFIGSHPSGLVGVTNMPHAENAHPILPETVFNVQSSGESNIRFSSLDLEKSSLELLSNGNAKASGLQISYSPTDSYIDFSSIRPSGCGGVESGFMSVTSNNFVGIGTTKFQSSRKFTPNSPLTIWHGGTTNSGTIALKEQASTPTNTSSFGKIYVKPDVGCSERQSLFFLDDAGKEFNLSHPSGFLKTDGNNTFGGLYAPLSSFGCNDNAALSCDTVYGFAAGYRLSTGDDNTLVGCYAGSGVDSGAENTIVGHSNLTNNNASFMTILGSRNLTPTIASPLQQGSIFSHNILIGTSLAQDLQLDEYTLLIGHGEHPVIKAGLGGTNSRSLSVVATADDRAFFSVDSESNQVIFTDSAESTDLGLVNVGVLKFKDTVSALQHRGMASLRFANRFDDNQTLVDFVPSGEVPNTSPSFVLPEYDTPYVAVSGDIKLLGAIRFSNGTVLDSAEDLQIAATSGIDKRTTANTTFLVLDFSELSLASSLTSSIDAGTSYLPLEVAEGSNRMVGKISIEALASYVSSGYASVSENCNLVWSDIESESRIDVVNNSGTVFIGCEVGVESTGWKNGVFLGTQAGAYSTTANTSLATSTSPIFIGHQAGYDCDDLENTIAIGTSAGKNADQSSDSIFIGSSAGLNSSGNRNCIGIGENALNGIDTPGHDSLGGNNNIEIVTGLNNNQRLLYASGDVNARINIQNVIAGNHGRRMISIGDARLSPQAPLEVRRDVDLTGHSDTENVQTWFDNDVTVARVQNSGDYIRRDEQGMDTWFGHYEGFMVDYIYAPSSYGSPTSGLMRTQTYQQGYGTDGLVWVTNRDSKLDIHGPGADGGAAFVVTARVNGENRPVFVSCSGDGS